MQLCCLVFLFILLNNSVSFAASTNNDQQAVNTQNSEVSQKELENKISELEEQINLVEQNEEVSKDDLYKALLDREKDVSSGLFNFTIFFVGFVTLFVTIGAIVVTNLINKLKEHQKRIDLVIDSAEFDEKISKMEQRLEDFRFTIRIGKKKEAIERFNKAKNSVSNQIKDIRGLINSPAYVHLRLSEIAEKYEFEDYIVEEVIDMISNFNEKSIQELGIFDDQDDSTVNLEEELEGDCEELESFLEDLTKLRDEIYGKLVPI